MEKNRPSNRSVLSVCFLFLVWNYKNIQLLNINIIEAHKTMSEPQAACIKQHVQKNKKVRNKRLTIPAMSLGMDN